MISREQYKIAKKMLSEIINGGTSDHNSSRNVSDIIGEVMDPFTKRHFMDWLFRNFNIDVIADETLKMIKVYKEDPEYWADAGWPSLEKAANQ